VSVHNRAWALAATTLALTTAQVEGSPFRSEDYAYSATLETTGPGPVYAASLPLEVYRSIAHPDLRDLCVVNAAGEVVPFAIRRPEPSRVESLTSVPLNLFPIHGATEAAGAALRLRLRTGETALDIERPATGASSDRPTSYLVDARSLQAPIAEIRVGWESTAAPFVAQLSIDASDDIEHWRRVITGAEVVNLHYAGQDFVRDTISVVPTRASFLRLTWSDVATAPVMTEVSARPQRVTASVTKLSYRVTGTPTSHADEYEFDVGTPLPVEQVNLLLPEPNSVVSAEFLVPMPENRSWRTVAHAQIYDLAVPGSTDIINAPIAVLPTPEQHWKVRIGEAGGGIGHGLPRFEVSWTPSDVLFLARGNGPYRLLFGNAAANSLALDPMSILDPSGARDAARRRFEPDRAMLTAAEVLGGAQRLKPAPPTHDWKRWILWSVLALGVAALGSMAWKLSKTME
jgi:hypothetical protein